MSDLSSLLKAALNPKGSSEIVAGAGSFVVGPASDDKLKSFLLFRGSEPSIGFTRAAESGHAYMAMQTSGNPVALAVLLDRRQDIDGKVGLLLIEQSLEEPVPVEVEQALLDRLLVAEHDYVRLHAYNVLEDRKDIYLSRGFEQVETLVRYRCEIQDRYPNAGSYSLRDARLDDVDRLLQIDEAAFEDLWRNDPSVMRTWAYKRAGFRVRVLEHEGNIVGFAAYRFVERKKHGHYVRTAIEPSNQGLGFGRALLADAISWFSDNGVKTVELTTQKGNRISRGLYETYGFKPLQGLAVFVWEKQQVIRR